MKFLVSKVTLQGTRAEGSGFRVGVSDFGFGEKRGFDLGLPPIRGVIK